ncbi:MAG: hypothetical protein IK138_00030 [Lachnospiraceae bacterium]|nr:hypothetical protein [Lachnospiraceae bacterium]
MRNKRIVMWLNVFLLIVMTILLGRNTDVEVQASGDWRGYAVYRDGVVGNLNDHAALMDSSNIMVNYPIIQASGPGCSVDWVSWFGFTTGENYLGLYKPYNCNMSQWGATFVSKARELRGTSYYFWGQIYYEASGTYVLPREVLGMRCDGLVEYVYEWFGFPVYGGQFWDITKNDTDCFDQHDTLTTINPRLQHEDYLDFVSSSSPM